MTHSISDNLATQQSSEEAISSLGMKDTGPDFSGEPTTQCDGLMDQHLLRRFVQDSDPDAFAEIVQRHSSLVMAVCRRVVGQVADAEDSFQATFLAFAKRPRSVRQCRSLTGWLYSVAFRTSVRMVRLRSRQAMVALPEQPPSRDPDPLDVIAADREVAILDEELNSLPQKYREVLVMSYFDGQSSQQIADQMNESKGVIDGRLRQARNLLRVRLARRSVAVGVVTVAAGLTSAPASAASSTLIQSTISLGAQALGHPVPSPVDLTRLEPLVRPELTMINAKLISGIVLGVAAAMASLSGGGLPTGLESQAGTSDSLDAVVEISDANTEKKSGDSSAAALFVTRSGQSSTGNEGAPSRNRSKYVGYSSAAKRRAADEINQLLADTTPQVIFPGDVNLSELMSHIVNQLKETGGRLNVQADLAELDLEGITGLEDVFVRNIELEGISLDSALDLIFAQTANPKLDFIIKDEVVLITTSNAAESEENMFNRSYDVSTILPLFEQDWSAGIKRNSARSMDDGFGGEVGYGMEDGMGAAAMSGGMSGALGMGVGDQEMGAGSMGMGEMGGFDSGTGGMGIETSPRLQDPADRLRETIQQMTAPPSKWRDSDGEGGQIIITGNLMMVRQSRRGHKAVVDVLEQL
ncbi:MAG: sigma-70 family RNA polymerase sigma factor, partial [Planctomycetaceae bacterium]|nr:sigma-70 family RNA polymerase sigma factor [Planctomycetaceae bacterium]